MHKQNLAHSNIKIISKHCYNTETKITPLIEFCQLYPKTVVLLYNL